MFLLKIFLIFFPRSHDIGHIHLIKGGQHCRGILGFLKPFSDPLAKPRHRHTFFTTVIRDNRLRRCGCLRFNRRCGLFAIQIALHITFGEAPTFAGTGNLGGINLPVTNHFADCRR